MCAPLAGESTGDGCSWRGRLSAGAYHAYCLRQQPNSSRGRPEHWLSQLSRTLLAVLTRPTLCISSPTMEAGESSSLQSLREHRFAGESTCTGTGDGCSWRGRLSAGLPRILSSPMAREGALSTAGCHMCRAVLTIVACFFLACISMHGGSQSSLAEQPVEMTPHA